MTRWSICGMFLFLVSVPVLGADAEAMLRKGTRSNSLSAGVAVGTTVWGGAVAHDAVQMNIHYGIVVSDLLAEDRFFRGRVALTGEFVFAHHYEPSSGFFFGASPLVRYIFDSSERWKPFLEAGVGFALTDIGPPNLAGKLQFSPQIGGGILWFFKPDLALTLEQRFVHYSNAGLRSPNSGVNQFVSLIGLTRFY